MAEPTVGRAVGKALFEAAFPNAARLMNAKADGKLGDLILANAFPNYYKVRQKYRNAKEDIQKRMDAKSAKRVAALKEKASKGTISDEERKELEELQAKSASRAAQQAETVMAVDTLTQVTIQTNDVLGLNSELLAQQNAILADILQQLKGGGGGLGGLSIPKLKETPKNKKTDVKKTRPPKPKGPANYKWNEKTGSWVADVATPKGKPPSNLKDPYWDPRYQAWTERPAAAAESKPKAAETPKPEAPKPTAEKAAGPPAAGGAGSAAVKGFNLFLIYEMVKDVLKAVSEIQAIKPGDPDKVKKVTTIITRLVAQYGLAWVGATIAAAIAAPTGPGALVAFVVAFIGGTAASYFLGDSIDELVVYVINKLIPDAEQVKTGADRVAPPPSKQEGAEKEAEEDPDKIKAALAALVGGVIEFSADEIKFLAEQMDIKAQEIVLVNFATDLAAGLEAATGTKSEVTTQSAPTAPAAPPSAPSSEDRSAPPASTPGGTGESPPGVPAGNGLVNLQTPVSHKSYQVAASAAPNFKAFVDALESGGYKINAIGGFRPSAMWHGSGNAIDINPDQNPMLINQGGRIVNKLTGKDASHLRNSKYPFGYGQDNLPPGIGEMAAKFGLGWGGNWRSSVDTMHFSAGPNEGGNIAAYRPQQSATPQVGDEVAAGMSGPQLYKKLASDPTQADGKSTAPYWNPETKRVELKQFAFGRSADWDDTTIVSEGDAGSEPVTQGQLNRLADLKGARAGAQFEGESQADFVNRQEGFQTREQMLAGREMTTIRTDTGEETQATREEAERLSVERHVRDTGQEFVGPLQYLGERSAMSASASGLRARASTLSGNERVDTSLQADQMEERSSLLSWQLKQRDFERQEGQYAPPPPPMPAPAVKPLTAAAPNSSKDTYNAAVKKQDSGETPTVRPLNESSSTYLLGKVVSGQ
mgnify:FL=1